MPKSNKVVDRRYIKNYVSSRLWELDKPKLMRICDDYNIEVKKNAVKDEIVQAIRNTKGVDYFKVYTQYILGGYFGLSPVALEELLGIDKTIRKKLEKKELIEVAYREDVKMNGIKVSAPKYSLLSLYNMTMDDLNAYKEKFKKKEMNERQKAALEKAREVALKNRTCITCGKVVKDKDSLEDNKCRDCIQAEIDLAYRETVRCKFKSFLDQKDNYIILDTETTGLSYDDEIVQIGIIDMNGDTILDTFISTEHPISKEASNVNGICKENLVGKPTIKDLNIKLNEIFKDKTVLIFNNEFDIRMLYQSGFDGGIKSKCIMKLYMDYMGSDRWIGLQRAMDLEDVDIYQDHSAINDCICVLELIKTIAARE